MTGEKFTLMQYSVNAILGLIEAEDFVIPEQYKDPCTTGPYSEEEFSSEPAEAIEGIFD